MARANWRLAGLTVLAYWAQGWAGLPVFAFADGAADFFGRYAAGFFGGYAGAGFLWGFLPAAMFVGAAAQWGMARNPIMLAGAMLVAHVILYIPGLAWGYIHSYPISITADGGLLANFLQPYVIGDLIKIAIAVTVVPLAYKAVESFKKG